MILDIYEEIRKNTMLAKKSMLSEKKTFTSKIIFKINIKNNNMDTNIVNIFRASTPPKPNILIRQGASLSGKLEK
ncbi:hypothetical protein MSSAC_2803 [Methanosarcina siciliae C2J]|uniref:Uncharacterized protein n=1 Tax=Methanosarcina siciliae C2J TaxID=1434118 RepID=A0A0E3PQ54_9EURY|nr:hypothetical protein MSSAC_2803 [Methanosarcina siciliae C2J]